MHNPAAPRHIGTHTHTHTLTLFRSPLLLSSQLESMHCYIQWLFPLCEKSPFNGSAPVLQREEIVAITADPGECVFVLFVLLYD